jgi:hypothetical protein
MIRAELITSMHYYLSRLGNAAIGALLLTAPALSQTVYKSVDESGETVYSDRPVSDALASETVELPPAPSDATIEQAQERANEASELADQLAEERAKKQQERKAAEKERSHSAAPQQIYLPPPDYGYPYHPRPPGHRPRPDYPYEWQGPGDHPAFRPPPNRPRPPPRPTAPPEAGGIVKPAG